MWVKQIEPVKPSYEQRRRYLGAMMTRRSRVLSLFTSLAAVVTLVGVAPVHAATDGPGKYQQAQVGLTYTVYAPSNSAGLKRTSFALNGCGGGLDEFINANYGHQTSGKAWIGLNEFEKYCIDGPDGQGPAATITVKGAKATIMGACAGGKSTCKSATRASVVKSGYTTVTLPGAGGLKSTDIEVYSSGLTVAQIRAFLVGLRPVQ